MSQRTENGSRIEHAAASVSLPWLGESCVSTLDRCGNRLLMRLPAADRRRLLSGHEPTELFVSDVLTRPGRRIHHVFFPIDSFVSVISSVDRYERLEVGLVGNEGMLGASLALGDGHSPALSLVLGAGLAWRVEATTFRRELELSAALRRGVSGYLQVSLTQLARVAVCMRFHHLDARLARWLLMARDRAPSNRFRVTHESLAYVLGVRRAGVTRAASALQARGLIEYKRGNVMVRDRRRLEAVACSCYRSAKETYGRVFAGGIR